MGAPIYVAADYARAFLSLLPFGRAWSRDPDALPTQVVGAMMPTYERQTDSAANLLVDAFPSTTVDLLPEWEATLGLPDPCAGESPTLQQRQAQVLARFLDTGGASLAYFVSFAATLGYDITIDQFSPRRFGSSFGRPFGGDAWAFAWQVNAPQFTVTQRKFGQSLFGEPYAVWENDVLTCELNRLKPAHTVLLFSFTEA